MGENEAKARDQMKTDVMEAAIKEVQKLPELVRTAVAMTILGDMVSREAAKAAIQGVLEYIGNNGKYNPADLASPEEVERYFKNLDN
jgi:hypothetical protein